MKKQILLIITFLLSTNSFARSDGYALKRKLNEFGYYSGPIDGGITAEVRNALKQFMRDQEACPEDVDPGTCRLLVEVQNKIN